MPPAPAQSRTAWCRWVSNSRNVGELTSRRTKWLFASPKLGKLLVVTNAASQNGVRREVAGDHRSRSDDGIFADGDAGGR